MKVEISEERLTKLIIKIIKSFEIDGLYRVQTEFPKTGGVVVALFFDTVNTSEYLNKKNEFITDRLQDLLGIDMLVLPIPYSEAKFHLREPKNV